MSTIILFLIVCVGMFCWLHHRLPMEHRNTKPKFYAFADGLASVSNAVAQVRVAFDEGFIPAMNTVNKQLKQALKEHYFKGVNYEQATIPQTSTKES